MQSELEQFADNGKSPYLTRYKDEVSAKQKLIRQRLGVGPSTENNPAKHDNIPSIDDEIAEQASQERRFKSRYSYFDNEAEESLQFFKKNLLPSSDYNRTASIFNSRPSGGSSNKLETIPKSTITAEVNRSYRPTQEIYQEPKSSQAGKYQLGSGRPVPFKQTSLNRPKLERVAANTDSTPVKESSASFLDRQDSSSSRASPERPEQAIGYQRSSSYGERQARSNRKSEMPFTTSTNLDFPDLSGDHDPSDIPPPTDSPAPTSTFTRKPLYNSLLRAHDSIRLKVNRPKVRPKSEVPYEDTAIDDSVELAEINPDMNQLNERAVDVKRGSSRRKSKKKEEAKKKKQEEDEKQKIPVRQFSEVRIVKVVRSDTERSLGVTVRAEDGNIVVARIMAGSLADKQGALQVGDIILSVNSREVYTPEQLQEELRRSMNEDTVILKIVPSFREELPTLCIYLRALFNYDANEDTLLPCKEVGVSFNQGDILEVVNQEDPNWWQARRVDSENLQTGLIPSQDLEERRRAFVIPDYDLATRISIFGTKISRKSKKKEIYNVGLNSDFDKAELQLYEEVCRTPAFERRTLVLIGANGVGKQAFKARLISMDPERFGTPLPHTSRLPRDGEEDGIHYHFVTREKMEEDIIEGRYLEYGEYDGALYGTKLDSVREIIGSGRVCVLDCSATCLKILKTSDYLPFVAFIAAPTLDQLRYMQEYARTGNRNYTTFDRALSRQSRRAKTLQDFAFDFFEDEDLQVTVEESARLFRVYENYFDIVLVNNNFETTFQQLKDAIDALSMAPQWIPISWIYGT